MFKGTMDLLDKLLDLDNRLPTPFPKPMGVKFSSSSTQPLEKKGTLSYKTLCPFMHHHIRIEHFKSMYQQ